MKVSTTLIRASSLDAAVALAINCQINDEPISFVRRTSVRHKCPRLASGEWFMPTLNWRHFGAVIDDLRTPMVVFGYDFKKHFHIASAYADIDTPATVRRARELRVAAMLSIVASKFGETVELP